VLKLIAAAVIFQALSPVKVTVALTAALVKSWKLGPDLINNFQRLK
jgi:hypothetical protein